MQKEKRMDINRCYLIIAPNPNGGYYHSLTERGYLVDNVLSFLSRHTEITPHQVTVYELREINESEVMPTV